MFKARLNFVIMKYIPVSEPTTLILWVKLFLTYAMNDNVYLSAV